ncbi:MAG: CRISPR-associated endonuclease Cas1 [Methylococcaceae bacterium]|nr:CRISPR-associated endonuclease Cas1 [Methylococcaceae bacterium]
MSAGPEFAWFSSGVSLRCRVAPPETRRGHGLEVSYALVKGVPLPDGCRLSWQGRVPLSRQALRLGTRLDLEFALTGATEAVAQDWFSRFVDYAGREESHFEVVGRSAPAVERFAPRVPAAAPDELCLEVLTPLRFRRPPQAPRTRLAPETLLQLIQSRIRQLFGAVDLPPFDAGRLSLLTHYWHYEEYRHLSVSARRRAGGDAAHHQYYNGCAGMLYLRGELAPLLPWLELLSRFNLDDARLSALGHFRILSPAPPAFACDLASAGALRGVAVEVLRQNDAAEGIAETAGLPIDEEALCAALAGELAAGAYQPVAYQGFRIPKQGGGGMRFVERLQPRDLIAQQRLLYILSPIVDHELSPGAFGFRKGRSREDAIAAVREGLREGYRHIVKADIEDFFPSIDHATLLAAIDRLIPRADTALRTLLARIVAAPVQESGIMQPRSRGLAEGSPLSPLLANLYLDRFDWEMQEAGVRVVRYGDDFVLLCRSRAEAERVLHHSEGLLADLHLHLAPEKTSITNLAEGFDLLGEHIDERSVEDPIEALLPQKKPLIVTEPYVMLATNGEALDVRRAGIVELTVPFRRISELIVFGRDVISTSVFEQCERHGVPVSIALDSGHHVATFVPDSRAAYEFNLRHAQWRQGLSATAEMALASEFVAAKIDNYAAYIRQRYAAGDNQALDILKTCREALDSAATLEAVRGHEGYAARAVFAWLQRQIKPALRRDFSAERRSRGGPDRLNSMLNFGYFLLFARLNTLVRSHGLNPYLGLLHDSAENYETLVVDFQEPFRVHIDRLVINLINYESIGADGFTLAPKGLWLTRPSARTFVQAFEKTLGEKIGSVVLRDALLAQVRALKRCVLGEGPFWVYRWKPAPAADREKSSEPEESARSAPKMDRPREPQSCDDASEMAGGKDR